MVIGAGPTGVELAGAIAELAHKTLVTDFRLIRLEVARLLLLEAAPRIPAAFPERLAAAAAGRLGRLRVEVKTNTRVEGIGQDMVLGGGGQIPARTILGAAGVAASPGGRWLGLETGKGGRVPVAEDLSVPAHPEVFTIGDSALLNGPDGRPMPALAPVAMQQGAYVARVVHDRIRGRSGSPPFRYRDMGNLATVGRGVAVAAIGPAKSAGFFAWLLWVLVRMANLISFRSRLIVLIEWAWAYLTFQTGARLITEPL